MVLGLSLLITIVNLAGITYITLQTPQHTSSSLLVGNGAGLFPHPWLFSPQIQQVKFLISI